MDRNRAGQIVTTIECPRCHKITPRKADHRFYISRHCIRPGCFFWDFKTKNTEFRDRIPTV